MEILLFAIVLLVSLFLIPLGLPGTWIMVGAAIGYDALVGKDPIGWVTIVGTAVLAIIAEIFEFSLSARYTKKYGGSRRAGWGAIIGAFVGSFIGALVAEYTRRESTAGTATRVATGALIGRVVAAAMKTGMGVVIAAWLVAAAAM
jgi:uncharacterized protein YqgC (DUF456 family)